MNLMQIYQELILDHNRNPRGLGTLEGCTHKGEGLNPLCGDHVEVFLLIEGKRFVDIRFVGEGCAMSRASASMMTEILKNKELEEGIKIFEKFREGLLSGNFDDAFLGKLKAFSGIHVHPTRIKCALLPWHAFKEALGKPHGEKNHAHSVDA